MSRSLYTYTALLKTHTFSGEIPKKPESEFAALAMTFVRTAVNVTSRRTKALMGEYIYNLKIPNLLSLHANLERASFPRSPSPGPQRPLGVIEQIAPPYLSPEAAERARKIDVLHCYSSGYICISAWR